MSQATRLSIFDFDETIAFTGAYADAYEAGTPEKEMTGRNSDKFVKRLHSQEEQDAVKKSGLIDDLAVEIDFRDYNKEVRDPQEVVNITNLLRQRIADNSSQAMVLTARGADSAPLIQNYLETLTDEEGNPRPISAEELIIYGAEGGNKGEIVLSMLEKYRNFKEVEFYDDSKENIKHMQAAAEKRPDIRFHIHRVHEGTW